MCKGNANCVWITPHLFTLVSFPYTKHPPDPMKIVSTLFLAIFIRERFPISRLTNIMCTSK